MNYEKRVLLIVPAYNEEDSIQAVVERITAFQPNGYTLDYLIVNDGSVDGTDEICRTCGFHYVSLVQNLGIGGAVQCGYRYALEQGYDVAVQFDGDGQHDITYLDGLVAPIFDGSADFTIGSRFLDATSGFHSTALRRVGIRYLSGLIRVLCRATITDPTSGFRAASRTILKRLANSYPTDYPEPESLVTMLCCGVRVREVPVNMFERTGGVSSIGVRRSVYYMCKVSMAMLYRSVQRKGKRDVTIS